MGTIYEGVLIKNVDNVNSKESRIVVKQLAKSEYSESAGTILRVRSVIIANLDLRVNDP